MYYLDMLADSWWLTLQNLSCHMAERIRLRTLIQDPLFESMVTLRKALVKSLGKLFVTWLFMSFSHVL